VRLHLGYESGHLQPCSLFCAAFGMRGVFNFGPQMGKTEDVGRAEYHRKDRQKALQIIGYSVLIALVVTTTAFFSPF